MEKSAKTKANPNDQGKSGKLKAGAVYLLSAFSFCLPTGYWDLTLVATTTAIVIIPVVIVGVVIIVLVFVL